MSLQRSADTAPEIALRRALYAAGLRFRLQWPVPGNKRRRIDIAFPGRKAAVFVDGCFWHECPEHGTRPDANADWWATKLDRNRKRDADTNQLLAQAGWQVIRIWEHESPRLAALRIHGRLQQAAITGPGHDGDLP